MEIKKLIPIGTTIVASISDQEKLFPCNLLLYSTTNPQASVAIEEINAAIK